MAGTRDTFRDAVAYAKAVLKDPVQKAYYEKKKKQLGLNSVYQAAITDYMRKANMESVNRSQYTGAIGCSSAHFPPLNTRSMKEPSL